MQILILDIDDFYREPKYGNEQYYNGYYGGDIIANEVYCFGYGLSPKGDGRGHAHGEGFGFGIGVGGGRGCGGIGRVFGYG
jgi:hypothetical protein